MIHKNLSQRTEEGQSPMIEAFHACIKASQDKEKILFTITMVRKDIIRTNASNLGRARKRKKK